MKSMKRDMELVRKILLDIEGRFVHAPLRSSDIAMDGYSIEEIGYHLRILADGGLIYVIDMTSSESTAFTCCVKGIAWQGHDFLDSVRNDGVWSHTKEALKPFGSASFEVVKSIAVAYISSKVGVL